MSNKSSIWQTALDECEAMVDHAFASGFEIPAEFMISLQSLSDPKLEIKNSDDPDSGEIARNQTQPNAQQLTLIHNKLSTIVAPASPRTLLLMRKQKDKGGFLLIFGRLPFIRYMMVVAIIAMISLITISMSPEINNDTIVKSLLENSGTSLLRVQLLFLSAAALGASFSALFQANQYIVNGTFDPKYEASYCIRFIVGLIAGIIMTQIIPTAGLEEAIANSPIVTVQGENKADLIVKNMDQDSSIESDKNTVTKTTPANEAINMTNPHKNETASMRGSMEIAGMIKITLALIGGFSASLVYLILNRIVETIKFFIEPTLSDKQAALESNLKNNFDANDLQTRTAQINGVISLQQDLAAIGNKDPAQVQELLSNYMNKILRPDSSMLIDNIGATTATAENNNKPGSVKEPGNKKSL